MAPPKRGPGGFTLIEAMVALALVGILLTLGLMTMTRVRVYERAMATRRAAYLLAESTLEQVYRGELLVPLGESELAPEDFPRAAPSPGVTRVSVLVEPADGVSDLYSICVAVSYQSTGLPKKLQLISRYWRPR